MDNTSDRYFVFRIGGARSPELLLRDRDEAAGPVSRPASEIPSGTAFQSLPDDIARAAGGVRFGIVGAGTEQPEGHCWVALAEVLECTALLRFEDAIALVAGLKWPPLRRALSLDLRAGPHLQLKRLAAQPGQAPRLAPVCTVLVAGHRKQRMDSEHVDEGLIRQRLHDALKAVSAALEKLEFRGQPWAAPEADRWTLRILTGMQDGFDAMARELPGLEGPGVRVELQVLAVGGPPTPAGASFGADIDAQEQDSEPAQCAVQARDELALGLADCLIVFWDGQAARGWAGGTVRLMHRALELGVPVLRIDASGGLQCIDQRSYDAASRLVLSAHAFPHSMQEAIAHQHDLGERLLAGLRQALLPGSLDADAYFAESPRHGLMDRWAGLAYRSFDGLARTDLSWLRKAFARSGLVGEEAWLEDALLTADRDEGTGELEAAFRWSDVQANVNAGHHRSTSFLLYWWSSVAVMAAILGHMASDRHWDAGAWLASMIEIASLALILLGLRHAKKRRWHSRWISHRYMAEQLRAAMLLRPWLALPDWVTPPRSRGSDTASLERWLLLRRLRTAGVAKGVHLQARAPHLLAPLIIRAQALFDGQEAYHEANQEVLEALHERMHKAATGIFYATAAAVVAFDLVWPLVLRGDCSWALVITAGLPAVAAALHGLKEKLELERLAQRSSRLRVDLNRLGGALAQACRRMIDEQHVESRGLARMLHVRGLVCEGAGLMSNENGAWHELIAVQQSDAP